MASPLLNGRENYIKLQVKKIRIVLSVADFWPRDPMSFWPREPGIGIFRIPDLGSRVPNPYFWDLSDNFLGKKFYNSLKIGPNFLIQHFKTKMIFNLVKLLATKKNLTTKLFFIPLFCCCFWIRDKHPGSATLIVLQYICKYRNSSEYALFCQINTDVIVFSVFWNPDPSRFGTGAEFYGFYSLFKGFQRFRKKSFFSDTEEKRRIRIFTNNEGPGY